MRKLLIASMIVCFSCSDNDDVSYSVAPELEPYIDAFFYEAADHNKTLSKTNLIAVLDSQAQSTIEIKKQNNQWYLYFDKETFEGLLELRNRNNLIESLIFHELGRIVLNRELVKKEKSTDPEPFSIMNGYYKVTGYSNLQRSALMDELFN